MYGQMDLASCLLARRLVEHHARFVEVSMGGWDTHNDNFVSVESRCQILDSALAGLISDLERRGLDSTLVALGTEFEELQRLTKILVEIISLVHSLL